MATEILGLDIGGTGIKGAPVNIETGELTGERFRIKTPHPATPAAVTDTAAKIAQHFNWQGAIGVGFPAVVKAGEVCTAANIDKSWIGTNGQKLLAEKTGCPVSLINDADAAGLAEMQFGAGKGQPGVVIMATFGTGIGTAIFIDGKLFPNTELGHLTIRDKDAEVRASDGARLRHGWSWKRWSRNVNEYLAELERLFWPDLFIVGGGASNEYGQFAHYLNTRARIVPAQMANLAGIVGAALAPLALGGQAPVDLQVGEAVTPTAVAGVESTAQPNGAKAPARGKKR